MARDYYADATALAAKLAAHGYGLWAQQLTDAIAAGATATEIVMALRWHGSPRHRSPGEDRCPDQGLGCGAGEGNRTLTVSLGS